MQFAAGASELVRGKFARAHNVTVTVWAALAAVQVWRLRPD
ncbi:MAG: hypothetical protein RMJ48_13355 [Roseiflexaceae bacterium]|nr:hypothetical protein [Roseiflexaceae bacterium]